MKSDPAKLEKKEDVRKEIKIEKEGKVDLETNKIRVAVCVIARKSNGDVLLSQRSKKLRTFPSVWVFPGGSLDEGEDLLSVYPFLNLFIIFYNVCYSFHTNKKINKIIKS